MDRELVRRWKAGFEMVAALDREELRRSGPDPERSIRVSLSMIDAARHLAKPDPVGDRLDAEVRERWRRLRERLR